MNEMAAHEPGKLGSSRRKGDEYQDLTALRFALKNYIDRTPFKMFLEYEKSGNLDDIVIFQGTKIFAYQVKYAINPLDVYEVSDLVDSKSPVYLKKFAGSWKGMKERHPNYSLTAHLYSNRGLDAALVDLVTPEGAFSPMVIENRRRGHAKQLRSELESASGIGTELFSEFLSAFQFMLRQPTLAELEQYIRTILLDKELGLSDAGIFFDLKEAIKQNAIFSREPITFETIDNLLERLQSKLLVPQVFPVNQDQFVERRALSNQLNLALPQSNGGYIIVTGLPGSGKSTSLTTYFKGLSAHEYEVFSYYCFVSVNDNAQRMRVQADSLRANLLSEFQRRYPGVLKRRFDYSERNFIEGLQSLAKYFVEQGRRFVIFLDGLDHAERLEPDVRSTVISSLPADIPNGVTIVVGTQELHKWPHFLKRARECPESHIQMPLFSEAETSDYFKNKRGISKMSRPDVAEAHKKCEGLPLYLQYMAEILISSESISEAISTFSPASGGDIRNYYELLWEEFERDGMGKARHLCATMACLHFSVHRNDLYSISKLDRPTFEDTYKLTRHLFRNFEDRLTVFHDSFRVFVISQLSEDWAKEVRGRITSFLKKNKNTPLWFGNIFRYCYDTEDYGYILDEVNSGFVECALLHCRPSKEILDAMHWAVESAFKLNDIVQLSRIGSLKFRTTERLEYNLDRVLLAEALLALGREQDVVSFAYSSEANRWLVESRTSLAVMYRLAEEGKLSFGRQLFDVFTSEFRGVDSDDGNETKTQVIGIAQCLGVYAETQSRPLNWLSQFKFTSGILEEKELYAPSYAPHLASYINALVKFGYKDKWTRLKRVKRLFPNNLVRYLLIRAFAHHGLLEELRVAVADYISDYPGRNIELAFYAAMAGMPVSEVSAITGNIAAPIVESPGYISPDDPMLRNYAYSFAIMAYEGSEESYSSLYDVVGHSETLWSSALHHLLKSFYCIGSSYKSSDSDWYEEAKESIAILVKSEQGEGERICELIDLIRDVLPLSIGHLTKQVEKFFPDRLNEWIECLGLLRDSVLWNTHFGIGESRQDYRFELSLWDTLADSTLVRPSLSLILRNCAETFEKSTMLKGGERSNHFIRLATIMAKCGMREEADKWLQYGIKSSLIYGYHKDVTIWNLIDVLDLVNLRQPERALERCARVLSMVDWMPNLTDGRETKWFPKKAFEAVLKVNQPAAFDLLKHFFRTKARWVTQDCLEEYLLDVTNGDPEYLWCLTELFANHFSDDGRHCKQVMGTRQHIIKMVRESSTKEASQEFESRYRNYVLTEVSPRHWPDHLKEEFEIAVDSDDAKSDTGLGINSSSEYKVDGEVVSKQRIVEKCQLSFTEFLATLAKLKSENDNYYDRDLVETSLKYHIVAAKSSSDLLPIKDYAQSEGRWQNSEVIEELADRFIEFGDKDNAIACFGMAYGSYGRESHKKQHLATIAAMDAMTAEAFVLKECYNSASGSDAGYNSPLKAAIGLDVLDKDQGLESVFNDFLDHCESMFVQLPNDDDYAWLENYEEPATDVNQRILNLVIDDLSTSEIDLGERITTALVRLAMVRSENVIPVLINRMDGSSERTFRRLLTVFHSLSIRSPIILVKFQQVFAQIIKREDFFCRQLGIRILRSMSKVTTLEASVSSSVQSIERKYSSSIFHSTYSLPLNPSHEFTEFLRRNTLFDFSDQVRLLEKILTVPQKSIVAAIEQGMKSQAWSIDSERPRVKDDWEGHVHPQGWPVVWINTEFQELATEWLWRVLNEAVEKMRLNSAQVCWLWQTIQVVDPERVLRGMMPRPMDIKPLHVADKEMWFRELDHAESFQVAKIEAGTQDADWITIYEQRGLAQEEKYNVPYRKQITLKAFLIPQQVYGGVRMLEDNVELMAEHISPTSAMPVTLEQAREELIGRGGDDSVFSEDSTPLIAMHQNPSSFFGYMSVCSLASFIINDFSLSFEDFDLARNGKVIAKYEAWQEGYQDETYTREKLSLGVRLRVHRDFLAEVCGRYRKVVCICEDEKREYYKSIYNRKPDEQRNSKRYILHHL